MRNSWPNYKIQWSPSEKTHANSKAKVVLRKVGGGGGGEGRGEMVFYMEM